MKLKVAGIVDDSVVDGDGVRLTVFTQGCPHRCPGCQNPETHDFNAGGYFTDTDDILRQVDANPLLSGVTFSGGEPFMQPAPLAKLAQDLHKHHKDVWSYSGFTLDELLASKNPAVHELLDEVDVLVDGRYDESQRDLTLTFRGSRNQRIIDMNAYRQTGKLKLLYANE